MNYFIALVVLICASEALGQSQENNNTCNPLDCKLQGYCTKFERCNKATSTWEGDNCDEGLYWNPRWNELETGGSCDSWDNLDPQTKETYENDTECYPFCYYKKNGECSGNFWFHPNGTDHRVENLLDCPTGLVFDDRLETCRKCESVVDSDGNPCCPSVSV